jgi:hypothetical protein
MRKSREKCVYCGIVGVPLERGHIIPKCLYPKSRKSSGIQLPTLNECSSCNRGLSDDEAHFRSVLVLAGETNDPVHELWATKVARSFAAKDGSRRTRDLHKLLVPVTVDGEKRHMIYPARDQRVIRVVKKIVRGLSHFRNVEENLSEDRLYADALKIHLPDEFRDSMESYQCDPEIFQCWYTIFNDEEVSAVWLLSFFERREFLVRVSARGVVLARPDWD